MSILHRYVVTEQLYAKVVLRKYACESLFKHLEAVTECSSVPFGGDPLSIDEFGGCRDRAEISHSTTPK